MYWSLFHVVLVFQVYFLYSFCISDQKRSVLRSSLFYITSARHERHECDPNDTSASQTTRVQHEWDTSDTSATRVRHECDTSATRVLLERHKCDTSATRGKNFDFDNNTSEIMLSHPYISYMANERLQEKEQFHSKNYLLEIRRSDAKMHLKSAPQKLNFVMAKAASKSYTLDFFYHFIYSWRLSNVQTKMLKLQ